MIVTLSTNPDTESVQIQDQIMLDSGVKGKIMKSYHVVLAVVSN